MPVQAHPEHPILIPINISINIFIDIELIENIDYFNIFVIDFFCKNIDLVIDLVIDFSFDSNTVGFPIFPCFACAGLSELVVRTLHEQLCGSSLGFEDT